MEFKELEAALLVPGRTLVFLDESELDNVFSANLRLYGGVVMRSDDYPRVEKALAGILSDFTNAKKFHAVEVRSPSKPGEGWINYSKEERAGVLSRWGACLIGVHQAVPYLYLRKDQWKEMLNCHPDRIPNGKLRTPDEALRRVTLRLLLDLVQRDFSADCTVFVADANGANLQEGVFAGCRSVFGESVFRIRSEQVAGLQLADLALYLVSRCTRLVAKSREDPAGRPSDDQSSEKECQTRDFQLCPLDQQLLQTFTELRVVSLASMLSPDATSIPAK